MTVSFGIFGEEEKFEVRKCGFVWYTREMRHLPIAPFLTVSLYPKENAAALWKKKMNQIQDE